jgi:predicted alpha-1,2-mannosidase
MPPPPQSNRPTSYVDCFHGVDGGGNCLPGPYLPFALVRLGPDTVNPQTTGYTTGQPLLRFSHTHVSGTGGSGRYGNIGLVPSPHRPGLNAFALDLKEESATPGYYRARLEPGPILAELTSTPHAGLHRYTFTGGPGRFGLDLPHLTIETGAVLNGEALDGSASWVTDDTCEGFGTLRGGWGHDEPYTVFFSLRLRTPPERTWCRRGVVTDLRHLVGPHTLAVARFPCHTTVEVEVGLSWVDVPTARRNRKKELAGRSFETVARRAAATWDRLLGAFRATADDPALRRLHYTMLYRFHCMPDVLEAGQAPWLPDTGREFNNLYCLWDSVRNANSLLALWQPGLAADLLYYLLRVGQQRGWIPDAWIAGNYGVAQGGLSAEVLFAESILKGQPTPPPSSLLAQLSRERTNPSPDPLRVGRYPTYAARGWLPAGVPHCVSRSIEYSLQENAFARIAQAAGRPGLARQARARARRIWELWQPRLRCFAPRHADGSWVTDFDPWRPQRLDFWADPYCYEGTAHEWSLGLVHDLGTLIEAHGGPDHFRRHLDEVLDRGVFLWKEIVLHLPWLYHFVGRPDLSARRVASALREHYREGRAGLADNEDMGSQSAFALGALAGIYPVMGEDLFLFLPPLLRSVRWPIGSDGAAVVTRRDENVTGLRWKGRALRRTWLRYAELQDGGELVCGPVETWPRTPAPAPTLTPRR